MIYAKGFIPEFISIFNMSPIIVGITSLARAGKDTFALRLVSKYSFIQLNMSDVLRDELVKQGKEPTKDNMSLLGDEWRKHYGKDIVIKRLLDKASTYEKVVITGLRSPEEVTYIKQQKPNLILVSVIAPLPLRFSRRTDLDPQTIEEFVARDERDIKNKGLDMVIEMSDYKVWNLGTLDELYGEVDKFIIYANTK